MIEFYFRFSLKPKTVRKSIFATECITGIYAKIEKTNARKMIEKSINKFRLVGFTHLLKNVAFNISRLCISKT